MEYLIPVFNSNCERLLHLNEAKKIIRVIRELDESRFEIGITIKNSDDLKTALDLFYTIGISKGEYDLLRAV